MTTTTTPQPTTEQPTEAHDTAELPLTSSTPPAASAPRRHRWADLALTALLAASVGSGATLATTGLVDSPQTAATSATSSTSADAATGTTTSSTGLSATSWAEVAANTSPSVVAITVSGNGGSSGEGSGVIWDDQGHIVTNNHVVSGLGSGASIQVQIGSQRSYAATVVGTDPTTDLAVLKLDSPPADLTPISRADVASVKVGDPVMALGNPLGLSGTVTTGIVSALHRPTSTEAVTENSGSPFAPASATAASQVVTNAIQTSAAINPGNSGGALVDSSGRLIGINSSIASMSSGGGQSGSIGIGFAIPVDEVVGVVDQLLQTGSVTHAALGIGTTDAEAQQGAATIRGAGVQQVQNGSAAAAAGLKEGDLITAVDGSPVNSAEGLIGQIRGTSVGDTIDLTILRDGTEQTLKATLTSQDNG